ncbi:hypothetical protein ACFX12_026950 [Malus domestica]
MARVCTRELFRFRSSISPHLASNPSKSNLPLPSSSFSSSSFEPSVNRHIFSLLDSCQSLIQITQLHAHLVTQGLFDSFWARKLLKSYYDFGDFDYTIWVFGYIDAPGRFCVNTVNTAKIFPLFLTLNPESSPRSRLQDNCGMLGHVQVGGAQKMMFELGKSASCETRPESKLYTAISFNMLLN